MQHLPVSNFLSLWEACVRIAEATGRSPIDDGIQRSLLGALKDGKLEASCDFENIDGKTISDAQPIFAKDWRGMTEIEFSEAIDRRRVLNLRPGTQPRETVWAINVRIETKQLDDWLSPPPRTNKASQASLVSTENACCEWLRGLAKEGELSCRSNGHWWGAARDRFGDKLSKRGYDRARAIVAKEFPEIRTAGRKEKK
ncbi:hypothetical protein [Rhodoblastus sp.]|uniref:hypothetical protein n=1 Tax=Rhodoblastus sp. TaxID=1962975 RepID=UPI003F9CEC9B